MQPRANIFRFGLLLLLSLALALPATVGSALAQKDAIESLKQTGQAFRAVARKVSPAVVFIKVEKESEVAMPEFPFGDELFRRFFGAPPAPEHQPKTRKRKARGQGSGFIISPDGLIMTNNHVVGDADKVTVRLLDGREFTADTIGTDPATDIALIKIDETDLPFLKLGNSDSLEVGDWVLAVGNPFGLSHTLTAGIVSAKGRSGIGLNDYENFIQTDAAINPGNSGGPLVNLDGQVVGINTAIFSRSGGYMGIGFAIPINMAKKIRDQLVKHGKVIRGRLGVYIQDLTPDLAESFGIDKRKGILIAQVIEDSPAEKAGLMRGDVILRIDGDPVGKVADFRNRIALTAPGTRVTLLVLRDGKKKKIKVTIEAMEGGEVAKAGTSSISSYGLSLQPLTPELADRLGYEGEKGVLVAGVEPGSPAEEAGIERGDLILEVNRVNVTTPAEVREALKKSRGAKAVMLVRHGETTRYLALHPNE
ncbi:MAG: DegQ family serine endoprotease [Deltaproteobacteria bacterium]|nr:MAG: DegQ family serine endoprotease [Deltaproteobacteria bacterium]